MEKVGLAIVGSGWAMSCLYAPAFRLLEGGRLVAAMDVDEEKARLVQRLYGIPRVYTELDGVLQDEEVQGVIVSTPTHFHAQAVVASADAGKHVYCEKPMAPTIWDCDAMIEACHKNNVKLQIAFMKPFNKSYRLVKSVLDEGSLGDVFEMRARWDNARATASAKTNYRHSRAAGGGFLQEDGSHPIHLCLWWLGDVREVSAEVLLVGADRFENEDVATILMKHNSGAISSLHITMLAHTTGEESYELFGTKGTLVMRWLYHSTPSIEPAIIQLHSKSKMITDLTLSNSWNPDEEIRSNYQYLAELEDFCRCVAQDEQPRVGGEDGKKVVEVINAAYLSSWKHEKVRLPLQNPPTLEELRAYSRDLQERSPWKLGEDIWSSRY